MIHMISKISRIHVEMSLHTFRNLQLSHQTHHEMKDANFRFLIIGNKENEVNFS